MNLDPELLGEIFVRLREAARTRPRANPPRDLNSLLQRGWAYMSQVEDYLAHYDPRLINFPFERALPLWDLHTELVTTRPKYVTSATMLMNALPVAALASLTITFERMGFEVDPAPLVDALKEPIHQRPLVTHCEFDVLGYEATQRRYQMLLTASSIEPRSPWEETVIRTGRGVRVKLITCAGMPFRLEARSTSYRAPKPSRFVTCPYCGHQYTTGDLQSRDDHRTQHARVRRVVDPTPKRQFISRLAEVKDPVTLPLKSGVLSPC